ncbi:hypothetical protein [Nostoc sp. 106C]|uniref:hypothetical protein n=1 Tax=Nostoc sp. 106C TaxID=1932667 RepID=UPI001412A5B7|nr:hypothetical protein [Nostoc sp. 106C]
MLSLFKQKNIPHAPGDIVNLSSNAVNEPSKSDRQNPQQRSRFTPGCIYRLHDNP